MCAPTKNGGASRRAGHRLVRKSGGGAGRTYWPGGGKRQNRYRHAKASRPWDGWPWLDRGERVRNGISKVWSKELEGKELLPAGHHIGGDFTGVGTRTVSGIGNHGNTILNTGLTVIIDAVEIAGGVGGNKFRIICTD